MPQQGTSNEYPQYMFSCRIRKIFPVEKSTLSGAVLKLYHMRILGAEITNKDAGQSAHPQSFVRAIVAYRLFTQSAFYVNLYRAVIGPSG